jgi:hypothetical protein
VSTDRLDPTSEQSPANAASAAGFFHADDDLLVPAEFATSPWGAMLHGRLFGGLVARAAEQARSGSPELACGRLTVDLFRAAPLAPVRVSTRSVRAGRRIAVLDVTIEQDDGPVAQGRVVLLRQSQQQTSPVRPAPAWDAPAPPRLGPPDSVAHRRWVPPWESWRVGAPGEPDGGPMAGGLWVRDSHPLVTGEPLTPLERLGMAADMVSPVSNSSAQGLSFINADYTVYLGREPEGEYVGVQPGGHVSSLGIAAGQCVLHDTRGAVGFASTAAVANPTLGSQVSRPDRG